MIERISEWKKEVGTEKDLYSVFKTSVLEVGNKKDAGLVGLLFFALESVGVLLLLVHKLPHGIRVASWLQGFSGVMVSAVASILGFLIAGFAIFATIGHQKLFQGLAQIRHPGSRLSEFKFVFFNFIYIFIHFVSYISLLAFSVVMFVSGPALTFLVSIADYMPSIAWRFGMFQAFVIFVCYTVYILLLLKSFIWNLYQSLLVVIFFEPPQ